VSKYFITGSAGAGKSSVIRELLKQGFTAYDTDSHPGATRFEDNNGNLVPYPKEKIDWDQYQWNWSKDVILELLNSAEDVLLGGVTSNQSEFYPYFDKIFVLTLDDATLRHRILSRKDKDYGKEPQQLEEEIAYRATRELDLLKQPRAVAVDATRALDKVTASIITEMETSK